MKYRKITNEEKRIIENFSDLVRMKREFVKEDREFIEKEIIYLYNNFVKQVK